MYHIFFRDFQVVLVVKNLTANEGDIRSIGSILGSGRSSGGGQGKEFACQCWRCKRCGFNPWVGKIP